MHKIVVGLMKKVFSSFVKRTYIVQKGSSKNNQSLKLMWLVNINFSAPKTREIMDTDTILTKIANSDLSALKDIKEFIKVKVKLDDSRFICSKNAVVKMAWVEILESNITEDEIKQLMLTKMSFINVENFISNGEENVAN